MADPQPPYDCPLPMRFRETAYADLPPALRDRLDQWIAHHPDPANPPAQ